jgi:hypothetical protein
VNLDAWIARRAALALLLVVMLGALATIFDREWRDGEIFSPADLVFQFYPWAYDAPRQTATNPTRSDEAFYHQPLMATHFARLRAGHLPDHDPQRLGGVPSFFQGLDTGRLVSPFSLPFYVSPAEQAVSAYGPLRLLVAALCMWIFLRGLGLSVAAAACGGLAFGLNGHFLTWLSAPMPTVAAWLPLALHFVRRTVRRTTISDGAGLAAAVGLMAVGSYMATLLVCLAAVGVYALAELVGTRRWFTLSWLAGGLIVGLLLGAAALGPMLAALATSPATSRVVSAEGAPWTNLATLAMPDFWGSPVGGTWWHPDPTANYPEHVAYLGVVVVALAGAGVASLRTFRQTPVGWAMVALAVLSLTRAYGGVPGRWLVWLPGQAQSNPFRWYAAAACATAVLAAIGLHALERDARATRDAHWWRPLLGTWLALGGLALAAGAALLALRPTIRALDLQALEHAQVFRFVVVAAATASLVTALACLRHARLRLAAAVALVVLTAADLSQANRRFNPTVPADQYYPPTAGLVWLADQALGWRIAPVDADAELVEGHVWGLFGLETVTGFDFHGDAAYQQFLHAARHPPAAGPRPTVVPDPPPTVWNFVGLREPTLDLRLLGLLGTRYIVTSPVDVTPRSGGYRTVGELTDGRVVTLRFRARYDGLRRIDLLTATHRRANDGHLTITLADEQGHHLANAVVQARDLPDTDWLPLSFPPVFSSAGRAFDLRVEATGAEPGHAATLWATAEHAGIETSLIVDGDAQQGSLWFRAFSSAPERVPGTTLAYAGDLNAYMNPYATPHAWFVAHVEIAPRDAHVSQMRTADVDLSRVAWLADAPGIPPTSTARVSTVEVADDTRRFSVTAPDGGVLVLRDRAESGWRVQIDGRQAAWTVANAVQMAVAVPPGSRLVTVEYQHPLLRPSLGLTALAVVGIALAFLLDHRRTRRR